MSWASTPRTVDRKSTTGTNGTIVAGPFGMLGGGSAPGDAEPSEGWPLGEPSPGDAPTATLVAEGDPPEGEATTPGVAAGPPNTATASSETAARPRRRAKSGVGRRRTVAGL
jgi:hypothetical protein